MSWYIQASLEFDAFTNILDFLKCFISNKLISFKQKQFFLGGGKKIFSSYIKILNPLKPYNYTSC